MGEAPKIQGAKKKKKKKKRVVRDEEIEEGMDNHDVILSEEGSAVAVDWDALNAQRVKPSLVARSSVKTNKVVMSYSSILERFLNAYEDRLEL